jgi:hypothetical protein
VNNGTAGGRLLPASLAEGGTLTMWRYDVRDISEQHFRTLRLLLHLNLAVAHIVVRSERPWPPAIRYSLRQKDTDIPGDAIN